MVFNRCPKCGVTLTQEMVDANMCWECGKILDVSLLDEDSSEEIAKEDLLEEMLDQLDKKEVFNLFKPEINMHKLTTGYNFEGYRIANYIGLVSGEVVFGTGFLADFKAGVSDFVGAESKTYSNKLKSAKRIALNEMIIDSIKRGGNAVIGISYEYVVFSGNMIGVSVNGTSVKLETVASC